MHRIDSANNVAVLPAPLAAVNDPGYFENEPGASPGTVVTGDFLNTIQEEIAGVIEGAGFTLDKDENGQLLDAIRALIAVVSPPGQISPFARAAAPAGWLLCDGAAVNRVTYSALFAAIGTTFGVGDAVTTFNLPDLRGRVPAGKDGAAGRLTGTTMVPDGNTLGAVGGQQTESAGVSVSGTVFVAGTAGGSLGVNVSGVTDGPSSGINQDQGGGGGVFSYANSGHPHAFTGTGGTSGALSVSADGGNSMSGATNTVTNVQPTLVVNYCIRT